MFGQHRRFAAGAASPTLSRSVAVGALLALSAAVPALLAAQPVISVVRMGDRADEHPEPFTLIAGLQELPDGRLVVADPREQVVRLVDFRAGTAQQIGREGAGPGEYRNPRSVLRWLGDTLLVYDGGNRRLLKVDPRGRLVDHISVPASMFADRGVSPPIASDAKGHVYFEAGDRCSSPPRANCG